MEDIGFDKFDKGIFIVNVLAIIYNKKLKKIVIGRRENDLFIPKISWTFPGGRPRYDQKIEESLRDEIKKKTGINKLEIKNIVFMRITPEIKRKQILIYYYCETEQEKIKAGEKFVEIKWIYPKEYKDYFTTSVNTKIANFLNNL